MPTINQLNSVDVLSGSDLVPVYSQQNGDARKVSLTNLQAFLQSMVTSQGDGKVKQYSSPNASGLTTQVLDGSDSVWLIVTPSNTFAAGTIKLPTLANCVDQQEVLVNYVTGVTGLTIDGNGAQVIGAPSTVANNGFFRLRFDAVMKIWYRVG